MTGFSRFIEGGRRLALEVFSHFDADADDGPEAPWRPTAELPETMEEGEQLHVLFGSPDWMWPILGMVTMLEGKEHWSVYLQDRDRFSEWEGPKPTLYCIRPELPEAAAAQG